MKYIYTIEFENIELGITAQVEEIGTGIMSAIRSGIEKAADLTRSDKSDIKITKVVRRDRLVID